MWHSPPCYHVRKLTRCQPDADDTFLEFPVSRAMSQNHRVLVDFPVSVLRYSTSKCTKHQKRNCASHLLEMSPWNAYTHEMLTHSICTMTKCNDGVLCPCLWTLLSGGQWGSSKLCPCLWTLSSGEGWESSKQGDPWQRPFFFFLLFWKGKVTSRRWEKAFISESLDSSLIQSSISKEKKIT